MVDKLVTFPKNVRIGRNGRIGILKKVPRDLWQHPNYAGHAKVIERSTGTKEVEKGIPIALSMLSALEEEFAAARAELPARSGGSGDRAAFAGIADANGAAPRPRQRGSSAVGERTRREILDAAMKEFAARGYSGAGSMPSPPIPARPSR